MTATNGATGRRISVHEAQVRTAAVEIKSLTITGKQVTLAVFRQLIEEDVIDYSTGHFNGLPWGTVNYCPGKQCRGGEQPHTHVVWQKGSELRRAAVWPISATWGHDPTRTRPQAQIDTEQAYINLRLDVLDLHALFVACEASALCLSDPYLHHNRDKYFKSYNPYSYASFSFDSVNAFSALDIKLDDSRPVWRRSGGRLDQRMGLEVARAWVAKAMLDSWPGLFTQPTDGEQAEAEVVRAWMAARPDGWQLGLHDRDVILAVPTGTTREQVIEYARPLYAERADGIYEAVQVSAGSKDDDGVSYTLGLHGARASFSTISLVQRLVAARAHSLEMYGKLRNWTTLAGAVYKIKVEFKEPVGSKSPLRAPTRETLDSIVARLKQTEERAASLKVSLVQRQAEIDALDQLFIAV